MLYAPNNYKAEQIGRLAEYKIHPEILFSSQSRLSCKSFNTVRSENLKTIWRIMSRTGSECRYFRANLLFNQNKLKYNFSLSKVSQKMLCFKATAIKRHKITVTKFYFQGQNFITLAFEGNRKFHIVQLLSNSSCRIMKVLKSWLISEWWWRKTRVRRV